MNYREHGQWKVWWESAKSGFSLPPAPSREVHEPLSPAVMTYYTIPLASKAVYFLLDVSGSMAEKVGTRSSLRSML